MLLDEIPKCQEMNWIKQENNVWGVKNEFIICFAMLANSFLVAMCESPSTPIPKYIFDVSHN